MNFESPWAFFLLPVIIVILIVDVSGKNRRQGLRFSSSFPVSLGIKSVRQRLLFVPLMLMLLGAAFLVTALARPRERLDESRKVTKGVAIELVIDRSSSMSAEIEADGKLVRRLDIVKQNLLDFINGNGKELSGRPDDLIGLIAFARYADTLSPLSLSHGVISDFAENLEIVTTKEEDGTSIGDALALAAARLKAVDGKNDPGRGYEISSRIIILLTDGENNAGRYSPREAAELAERWGIKVYSIGFGGTAYYPVSGLFGTKRVPVGSAVDAETLKGIAEITGGSYFQADTAEDLSRIYEAIDGMEKTEIISTAEYKYKELFVIYALTGLLLLAAGVILDSTLLRRLP